MLLRGLRRGRDGRDLMRCAPCEHIFYRCRMNDGQAKERADTRPYRVRVIGVGGITDENDAASTHGIDGAKDRAEIAGVADRIERDKECGGRYGERIQPLRR